MTGPIPFLGLGFSNCLVSRCTYCTRVSDCFVLLSNEQGFPVVWF